MFKFIRSDAGRREAGHKECATGEKARTGGMQEWSGAGQEGRRTRDIHDRRDSREEGFRGGGMQERGGCRKGVMQEWKDSREEGCRKGRSQETGIRREGMQERGMMEKRDDGKEGCRKDRGVQERRVAGKEGCRNGGIRREGLQPERMDAG